MADRWVTAPADRVAAAPVPFRGSVGEEDPEVGPDPSVYESTGPYPEATAAVISSGMMRGRRLETIEVRPVRRDELPRLWTLSAHEYLEASRELSRLRSRAAETFESVDALLCPTTMLPARPVAERAAVVKPQGAGAPFRAARVLLVDDEQRVLDGYRRNLRKEFDLHTASSGSEGLELIHPAVPFAVGLVVMGGLVAMSHWFSLQQGEPGITTEAAALMTFTIGGCAAKGLYWIAIATGIVTVILLHEKRRLEGLANALPRHEMRTLLRFLLLTAVILPVVPNRDFTPFEINPFKLWLVVVAVLGVSYFSYLLRLWWGEDRGLFLADAHSADIDPVIGQQRSNTADGTRSVMVMN